MEHLQRLPLDPGVPEMARVLLAGFPTEEAKSISTALDQLGCETICLYKEADVEASFVAQRFDVTFIDAEHFEVFAPHFITRLRGNGSPSSDATIIVVDNSMFSGFGDQLAQSGADLVVPKLSDPKMYMVNFTRAATVRLRNIGRERT